MKTIQELKDELYLLKLKNDMKQQKEWNKVFNLGRLTFILFIVAAVLEGIICLMK